MEKMQIGKSGIWTTRLSLGTFAMGGGTSWQDTTKDDDELVKLILDTRELGIESFDTAPVYGTGRSERIVGRAIKGRRHEFFISTKCSLQWRTEEGKFEYSRDGKSVYRNFKKESILQDVEDSLKRLDTDYIDLLIVHRCPEMHEIEGVMEAMDILKKRGLIRATGLSNASPAVLEECLKYGEIDLVQERASLLDRRNLDDYIRCCEKHSVTFQTYGALEEGVLTGKKIGNVTEWKGDVRSKMKWFQPENAGKIRALFEGLAPIAQKYNCSIPVLCLAWVKAQSDCINLLFGARKLQSVKDTLLVENVKLEEADIAAMTALSDAANAQ